MLPERAGRPPLLERAFHRTRCLPGSRLPQEGAWDDALVLVLSPSSCIRSRPSRHRGSHSLGGRKEKREGAGKARRREEERWGGRERKGRESLSFAVPPPLLSGWRRLGSPFTPSPSSLPPTPPILLPSLPSECAGGEPQPARSLGRRGRRRGRRQRRRWVCACV